MTSEKITDVRKKPYKFKKKVCNPSCFSFLTKIKVAEITQMYFSKNK